MRGYRDVRYITEYPWYYHPECFQIQVFLGIYLYGNNIWNFSVILLWYVDWETWLTAWFLISCIQQLRSWKTKLNSAVEAFPQQTPARLTEREHPHKKKLPFSIHIASHNAVFQTPTETALVRLAGLCLCLYFGRLLATALFLLTDPHRLRAGRPTGSTIL